MSILFYTGRVFSIAPLPPPREGIDADSTLFPERKKSRALSLLNNGKTQNFTKGRTKCGIGACFISAQVRRALALSPRVDTTISFPRLEVCAWTRVLSARHGPSPMARFFLPVAAFRAAYALAANAITTRSHADKRRVQRWR